MVHFVRTMVLHNTMRLDQYIAAKNIYLFKYTITIIATGKILQ